MVDAIRKTSDLPIIMVTGFGGMMLAAGERPPGVDFILSKPVAIGSLRKAIVNVLNEKSNDNSNDTGGFSDGTGSHSE